MAAITFPFFRVVNDLGAVITDATVAIVSVTDKAGTAIASHGATVNQAGANVSVDYDALAKGEAWITLSVVRAGSTFAGLADRLAVLVSKDSHYLAGYQGLLISGKVVTAASGTSFTAVGVDGFTLSSTNSFYVNAGAPLQICFTSGDLKGLKAQITGYTGATKTFTLLVGFPAAPAVDDTFLII